MVGIRIANQQIFCRKIMLTSVKTFHIISFLFFPFIFYAFLCFLGFYVGFIARKYDSNQIESIILSLFEISFNSIGF